MQFAASDVLPAECPIGSQVLGILDVLRPLADTVLSDNEGSPGDRENGLIGQPFLSVLRQESDQHSWC